MVIHRNQRVDAGGVTQPLVDKNEGDQGARLGGVGGQGIALAGTLLGKAAALFDDKDAVFTQTYGPEARGGASRADIIISDSPIAYPFVTNPNEAQK